MPLSPSILCQTYRNKYLAMHFPNHDSIEFFPLNIINGSNAMLATLTTILSVFSKYAPIKKKYIQANEAPFMTKNLHKEIMKRSRLRNKYLKSKSLTDRKNYNIQRNYQKRIFQ